MNEKISEFIELIKNNPELKSKVEVINNTPGATAADFIALAKEYGIEITEQDLTSQTSTTELSSDELEAVTGGYTQPGRFCLMMGLICSRIGN